jgi:hypothetical protein
MLGSSSNRGSSCKRAGGVMRGSHTAAAQLAAAEVWWQQLSAGSWASSCSLPSSSTWPGVAAAAPVDELGVVLQSQQQA